MRYILIAGLPGSGKTTLARELSKKLTNSIHLEDPSDGNFSVALKNSKADYVIIDTPHFCIADNRNDFMDMLAFFNIKPNKISWICFSNNKEMAMFNVIERESGERQQLISVDIDIFSNEYTFPKNALIIETYPEPYNLDTIIKHIQA